MSFLAPKTDMGQPTAPERQSYDATGPVPVVFGRARVGLKLIESPWNHQLVDLGSRKPAENVYTLAAVGCHGPVSKLYRLWINGQPIFTEGYDAGVGDYTDLTPVVWDKWAVRARVYWGKAAQAADPLLTGTAVSIVDLANGGRRTIQQPKDSAGNNRIHPPYAGLFYVIFYNLPFSFPIEYASGSGRTQLPQLEAEVLVVPPDDQGTSDYHGANPIAISREILRNPIWGADLPTSLVPDGDGDPDYNGWKDAAWRLNTDGYAHLKSGQGNISPVLAQSRNLGETLADVFGYFDGFVRLKEGVLIPDWFPNQHDATFDPDDYTTLARHDMTDEPDIDVDGWDETLNEVGLRFRDVFAFLKEDEVKERSPYNRTILGRGKAENIEAVGIINWPQAKAMAKRVLHNRASPGFRASLKLLRARAVNPDGTLLMPGDLCYLNYEPYALQVLCRVEERMDERGGVRLTLINERGAYPEEFVPVQDEREIAALAAPGTVSSWRLFELPSGLAPDWPPRVAIIANRPNTSVIYARAWIDASDVFDEPAELARVERWADQCKLTGSITDEDTALDLEFAADAVPGGLDRDYSQSERDDGVLLLLVGHELIGLGVQSDDPTATTRTYTVKRGMFGTTAASHADEADVWLVSREFLLAAARTHALMEWEQPYDGGEATVYVRLQPHNGLEAGDVGDPVGVMLQDRTPAVPGNFTATPQLRYILLNWTDPVLPFAHVQVQRSPASQDDWLTIGTVPPGNGGMADFSANTWNASGPDYAYDAYSGFDYRVRAIGLRGEITAWSDVQTKSVLYDPAPTGLEATVTENGVSDHDHKLTWVSLGAGVEFYRVSFCSDTSDPDPLYVFEGEVEGSATLELTANSTLAAPVGWRVIAHYIDGRITSAGTLEYSPAYGDPFPQTFPI